MPGELPFPLEKRQAEFAEEQFAAVAVLGRKRREVPGVDHIAPQLDPADVLHLRELLVLAKAGGVKVLVTLNPRTDRMAFSTAVR